MTEREKPEAGNQKARKADAGKPEAERAETVRFTSGYTDVPLSFPERPQAKTAQNPIPEPIRKMREAVCLDENFFPLEAETFYRQGRMMAHYDDNYVYHGRFMCYYPTYQAMTVDQLRGYFTWRTKWRRLETALLAEADGLAGADSTAASMQHVMLPDERDALQNLSFAYLHAYELISNTDDQDPKDGWLRLAILDQQIGQYDTRFHLHLQTWMRDFAVYYSLDRSFLRLGKQGERDEAIRTLEDFERNLLTENADAGQQTDTHRIFQAIALLSARDPIQSPFYKKYSVDLEEAVVRSYAAISRYYQQHGRSMLVRQAFGSRDVYPCRLFHGAVFYDHLQYEDYTYDLDAAVSYHCRNGSWTCRKYRKESRTSQLFGDICQETERLLRQTFAFRTPLKKKKMDFSAAELISRTVGAYLEEKKEAVRPKVRIDLSHLETIRQEAAHTRDQLIVGEEEEPAATESPASLKTAEPAENPEAEEVPKAEEFSEAEEYQESGSGLLSPVQSHFLRLLLDGGDWKAFVRSRPDILSVGILVDEINEALYEEIGDTVIELDGETPVLIEEYRKDAAALI